MIQAKDATVLTLRVWLMNLTSKVWLPAVRLVYDTGLVAVLKPLLSKLDDEDQLIGGREAVAAGEGEGCRRATGDGGRLLGDGDRRRRGVDGPGDGRDRAVLTRPA